MTLDSKVNLILIFASIEVLMAALLLCEICYWKGYQDASIKQTMEQIKSMRWP